jgi:hypothetical protein
VKLPSLLLLLWSIPFIAAMELPVKIRLTIASNKKYLFIEFSFLIFVFG